MSGAISFVVVFVILIATLAVIAAVAVAAGSRARMRRALQYGCPVLNSPAKVVDERTAVTGNNGQYGGTTTTYFATFELPDGQRLEFVVDGAVAGQIAVGDIGSLYWQGTWFKGFQR